jgi:hypothetical protein
MLSAFFIGVAMSIPLLIKMPVGSLSSKVQFGAGRICQIVQGRPSALISIALP